MTLPLLLIPEDEPQTPISAGLNGNGFPGIPGYPSMMSRTQIEQRLDVMTLELQTIRRGILSMRAEMSAEIAAE